MIESDLAAAMLGRGTDKMTRQQIADEMTRLQMTGGLTGFQTTRENLPDALRLLAHVMRAASFPADRIRAAAAAGRDIAAGAAGQPGGDLARRARRRISIRIRRAIRATTFRCARGSTRSARRRLTLRADFTATFTERRAVKSRSSATSTPSRSKSLVNELFTEYQSKAPYARLDREYREVKPARLTVDTPEKENAFIRGAHRLSAARRRSGCARAGDRERYLRRRRPGCRTV